MSDIISDGYTRVSWVSSISNTAAPTATELNAGVALESYITADGYENGVTTAKVDTTALNSTQNTAAAGRREDTVKLTMKQQGKGNAPWSTFASNPSGYLVRRSGVAASTAWASSQKVTVIPCQAGFREEFSPAANMVEKLAVEFIVNGAVVDTAAVA